jgi:hypothetical protein
MSRVDTHEVPRYLVATTGCIQATMALLSGKGDAPTWHILCSETAT